MDEKSESQSQAAGMPLIQPPLYHVRALDASKQTALALQSNPAKSYAAFIKSQRNRKEELRGYIRRGRHAYNRKELRAKKRIEKIPAENLSSATPQKPPISAAQQTYLNFEHLR